MLKLISLLLFVPAVSSASSPLNFEFTLLCSFSENCRQDRVEWAYEEMTTQYLKTRHSHQQWIETASTRYDSYTQLEISLMELRNYNTEFDRFVQHYKFVFEHADHFLPEEKKLRVKVANALAKLSLPERFELYSVEQLSEEYQQALFRHQSLIESLEKLVAQQGVKSDLVVGTQDETLQTDFTFAIGQQNSGVFQLTYGLQLYSLVEPQIYIVSDPEVLAVLDPIVTQTPAQYVRDLDTYMQWKNQHGASQDSPQNYYQDQDKPKARGASL